MNNCFSKDWLQWLQESLEELLAKPPLAYKSLTPSQVPEIAGIYLISEKFLGSDEVALYIGRSKNLRDRIYRNHLMGNQTNARLKKYMVSDSGHPCYQNEPLTKEYIRTNCSVRWIAEEDMRKRGALEAYFTGIVFPKYGIAEEH